MGYTGHSLCIVIEVISISFRLIKSVCVGGGQQHPHQTLKNLKKLKLNKAKSRGGEVTSLLGFLQQQREGVTALVGECVPLDLAVMPATAFEAE